MRHSPASGVRFVHPGGGLNPLKGVLQTHIQNEEIAFRTSQIVCILFKGRGLWDASSAEYARFRHALKHEILPVLVECFKLHLRSTAVLCILNALLGIAIFAKKTCGEVRELVREVILAHPTNERLQKSGSIYLTLFRSRAAQSAT